jgi:hypothetical protein
MKNSSDTIWSRTLDHPACSAVPQPTAPTRTPNTHMVSHTHTHTKEVSAEMQTPNTLEPGRQQHENLRRMLSPRSVPPKTALSFPQRTIRCAFQVSLFQFIFKPFLKSSINVELRSLRVSAQFTAKSTLFTAQSALFTAQSTLRQRRHLYLKQKPLLLMT